jgi:hypothetical protein
MDPAIGSIIKNLLGGGFFGAAPPGFTAELEIEGEQE